MAFNTTTLRGKDVRRVVVGLGTNESPTAIVFTVSAVANSNPEHPLTLWIGSCDGTVTFNTTKPGVFVVPGAAAAVFIERWYRDDDKLAACPGKSSIAFSSAPLSEYCKVDATLAECNANKTGKTDKPTNTPKTTSASNIKQSVVVSTVAILSMFVAALV